MKTIHEILLDVLESSGLCTPARLTRAARLERPGCKASYVHVELARMVRRGEVEKTGEGRTAQYRFIRRGGEGVPQGFPRRLTLELLQDGPATRAQICEHIQKTYAGYPPAYVLDMLKAAVARGELVSEGPVYSATYSLAGHDANAEEILPTRRTWLHAGEWGGVAMVPQGVRSVFDLGGAAWKP